ncbi:hypothetical protein V8F33_012746 [Rhypophila sp. PSN 637]
MKTTTSKKSSQDKSIRHSTRSQARVTKNKDKGKKITAAAVAKAFAAKAKGKQPTAAPAPVGTTLVEKLDTLKRRMRCLEANVSGRLEDVNTSIDRLANLVQKATERAAPVQQGQESTPATAAPEPPRTPPGIKVETVISIPATPESLSPLRSSITLPAQPDQLLLNNLSPDGASYQPLSPYSGTFYEPDEPIAGRFLSTWALSFPASTSQASTTPELYNTNEQQHNDNDQESQAYTTNAIETLQNNYPPVPRAGCTIVPIIPQTNTICAQELCWAMVEVINSVTHDTWYFDSDQVVAEYCAQRLNRLWNKEFDHWLPLVSWLRQSLRSSGFLEEDDDDMWRDDNRPCVLSVEHLEGLYLCDCICGMC